MSVLHDTANDVKDLLETADLSKSLTARLVYDTELPLEDEDELHVDIVPAGLVCQADSRASLAYDVYVDVAVRFKFGTSEQETDGAIAVEEIDGYIELLEEIGELLADPDNRMLPGDAKPVWIGNEIRAPWVPQHLREFRQYTGIMRSTYRVAKDY